MNRKNKQMAYGRNRMNMNFLVQKAWTFVLISPLLVFFVLLIFFAISTTEISCLVLVAISACVTSFLIIRKYWMAFTPQATAHRRTLIRKLMVDVSVFIVILSVIFGINYVFDPFIEQVARYPNSIGVFRDRGAYRIEPETIIESLDRGKSEVFLPQPAPIEKYTQPSQGFLIPWKQADYVKIANALYQFVWKESLDGWKLAEASFATSCRNNLNGFSIGGFIFYETIFLQSGEIRYAAREIDIRPLDLTIDWGGGTTFPHPVIYWWKNVDLSRAITAEEALIIAEQNGGEAARLSVQDKCTIRLNLSGYSGWGISYDSDLPGVSNLFEININAFTGAIE